MRRRNTVAIHPDVDDYINKVIQECEADGLEVDTSTVVGAILADYCNHDTLVSRFIEDNKETKFFKEVQQA